jgi:hypothetical protein
MAPIYPALLLMLVGAAVLLYYRGPDPRFDRFLVVLAAALPANMLSMSGAMAAGYLRHVRFDLYVYRIDSLLGLQPSFALGQFVSDKLPLVILLKLSYDLLPVAIVSVFGGYLWHRSDREAVGMVPVFLLNLALGVPFYLLCPVAGPLYAFPSFPALPIGPIIPHAILLNAPPNGMPSIHFSSALLIFWYARKLPSGRWLGGIYLLLIAAATMAGGEHYFLDLLMAIPYSVMMYWLGTHLPARWKPWCARRDSNSRPFGSKPNALSS